MADAVEQLGGLSIRLITPGVSNTVKPFEELTTEDFDATFKTNVYAPFWITRAALPHLRAGSAIINTTSVQAYKPSPILLDYAQTKACLAIFTKSLAKQVAKRGIRVNAVARPLLDGAAIQRRPAGREGETVWQRHADGAPGATGRDRPAVCHPASDACSYTSGQVWCSDGGDGVV